MSGTRRHFLKLAGLGSALLAGWSTLARRIITQAASGPSQPEGITEETFAEAEKLFGLEFTPAERRLMLGSIRAEIEAARAIRHLGIKNDGPAPATVFQPRLPQTRVPSKSSFRPSGVKAPPLPTAAADIAYAPLVQLAEWIRTRQLSSRRLTEIYLERIERFGPKLESMVTVTRQLALDQADAADREIARGDYRGPLHGIPYGAKDLLDTRGIRTTWGAMPYKDRVAARDATVVAKLRDAGAVLLGKTTLGALAYDDLWWGGRTRNPWDIEEGAQGSSAGSGASVAAGLMGFALGTETLGSIAAPATKDGTVGLRPTFGRVSRYGAMVLCWSLDKIGVMSRSVEDAPLVLQAMQGPDPRDVSTGAVPLNFNGQADHRGARLGFVPEWFEDQKLQGQGRRMLDAAEKAGMKLIRMSLPDLPYDSLLPILYVESSAAMEELTLSGRDELLRLQTANAWPNSLRYGRFVSAVDLIQMQRFRRLVMEKMHEQFESVDAIIGPGSLTPMLLITNFTGHPALTLRAGFIRSKPRRDTIGGDLGFGGPPSDKEYEVPVALTIWGPLYEDGRICEIGMALQRELGVWQQRPPMFS